MRFESIAFYYMTKKELQLLSGAISDAKKLIGWNEVNDNKDTRVIYDIVRNFVQKKNVLCYGGTAINALLDEKDRFYDENYDLPDYDFFSMKAIHHAKELANIYSRKGYLVEAKSGQHHGTYKVFVNFMPVADVTQCDSRIFQRLWSEKMIKAKINYVPPHFLRWSMYLELSRPMGDVSRWEKVYKRLMLLDAQYPLKRSDKRCTIRSMPRQFVSPYHNEKLFHLALKKLFIQQNVIFFGYNALNEYAHMYSKHKKMYAADFEVISHDPNYASCANNIKQRLEEEGYQPIYIEHYANVDEFIPCYYEVRLGQSVVAHIYKSESCYSYNLVYDNDLKMDMRVASIETMFSMHFIFFYKNDHYNSRMRLLCMAEKLLDMQNKNRHETGGLLKRFQVKCAGRHETKRDILEKKYRKMLELYKGHPQYEEWFLNYKPHPRVSRSRTFRTSRTDKSRTSRTSRTIRTSRTVPRTRRRRQRTAYKRRTRRR